MISTQLTVTSIVHTYNHLLANDHALTMQVAAIESLIALLSASPPSTISETLSLLESNTATLKASVSNPIALSAGTDLFQRYIISTLQSRPSTKGRRGESAGGGDFKAIRAHLLANSRLFVQRAKEARGKIAGVAKKFVRDGCTVLTSGGSRVVAAVLNAAADEGVRFRVIYAQSALSEPDSAPDLVGDLRRKNVPVAVIPFAALATAIPHSTFVLVGSESVVENGGSISNMGTYQMGLLAKSAGKPFYVVAETHKFVRVYPLSGADLPLQQKVLDFRTDDDGSPEKAKGEDAMTKGRDEVNEFTPPGLITALITESGVHTPSAVSEELIKIWY